MQSYKVTNLTGTRWDPKRRNRTGLSSKAVRFANLSIPPGKSRYMSAESLIAFKYQMEFFQAHGMIRITGAGFTTIDDLISEKSAAPEAAPPAPEPVVENPSTIAPEEELAKASEDVEDDEVFVDSPAVVPEDEPVVEPGPVVEAEPEAKPKKKRKASTKKKKTTSKKKEEPEVTPDEAP